LGRNRAASACIDLSDGLADGLRQIAEASGVGIAVDASLLPISDEVRRWHQTHDGDPMTASVAGGDDYELLFTSRPAQRARLGSVRRQIGGLAVTKIGTVTKDRVLIMRTTEGDQQLPEGFEHFRCEG
jgi:thiamine-monophosphate kinase